ncbi:WD40/YVTN/BNR-like repeat-containing protein [Halobaculum sp. MBLA0147]|uniref:WD40/YVTN/BNR-like repeat-containing protein n=1 Tax=Halobaculum sp. MBLA0147 TaxID=3079934 RepID=UPI003525ABFE
MTHVYLGTRDGLYRLTGAEVDDSEPVRVPGPSGPVGVDSHDGSLYCRGSDGVYRVETSGTSESSPTHVESIPVPTDEPTHLHVDGEGFVVGGRAPLAVHRSPDGERWETVELPDLDPARRWIDGSAVVVSEAGGRVSDTLRTDDGLAVAVERTGVFHLADGAWESRHQGLAEDVHDLHRTPDGEWVAATGHGLYRTTDDGVSWRRLDTGQLFQGYTYFHEFARLDGTLYTSGGRHMPGDWPGADAEALVFAIGDGRCPLRAAPTPDTTAYTWALSAEGGWLYAGTATADVDEPDRAEGVCYRRETGSSSWAELCRTPDPVVSVAVVTE